MTAYAGNSTSFTAQEIAETLGGQLIGDPERSISAIEVTERATSSHLTFIGDEKLISRLRSSAARVVIAPPMATEELEALNDKSFILVAEPEVAFLKMAARLHPRRRQTNTGIAPTAVVDPTAVIGNTTVIGHHAVIGADVTIGTGCRISPGVVIEAGCSIGDNVNIQANTVLYSDVIIGNSVTIYASCVIGADGFGYRTVNGRHEHLPHFGIVRICDDVEIGADTTIDRAKVGETVIGEGTRIDNQVMVAHNCRIGPHNLLVSQTGLAGSASTGSYVVCAGQSGIADHVHLGDGAVIGAQAGVHRNMKGGQSYFGTPAAPVADATRQMTALRRLPELRDSVRQLKKDVSQLQQRHEDSPSPGSIDAKAA